MIISKYVLAAAALAVPSQALFGFKTCVVPLGSLIFPGFRPYGNCPSPSLGGGGGGGGGGGTAPPPATVTKKVYEIDPVKLADGKSKCSTPGTWPVFDENQNVKCCLPYGACK